jgi:hypothetical protein
VNGRDETKCRLVGTCPDVSTKWFMILRSPTENENAAFVIPAWIAGIQVRKDASEDVHVTLDSSNPCWNDVIEEVRLQITEVPPPYFKRSKLLWICFTERRRSTPC